MICLMPEAVEGNERVAHNLKNWQVENHKIQQIASNRRAHRQETNAHTRQLKKPHHLKKVVRHVLSVTVK